MSRVEKGKAPLCDATYETYKCKPVIGPKDLGINAYSQRSEFSSCAV